jgi:hypothetical protein
LVLATPKLAVSETSRSAVSSETNGSAVSETTAWVGEAVRADLKEPDAGLR